MYGNHLGNTERVQPESLSRKYGNQKPFRNFGQPSTFAESSQTDIPKSAKVRPSAFLKMNRPHRLFGHRKFSSDKKSDLIASQTSRNQIVKVGRGADIGRVMKPNPQKSEVHTHIETASRIGMEFQQDRHQRNQIRETLKLTFVNIFRF